MRNDEDGHSLDLCEVELGYIIGLRHLFITYCVN